MQLRAHATGCVGEPVVASHVVTFAGLSDQDRKKVAPLPKLVEGDRFELHVRRRNGQDQTMSLPPAAASAVEALIDHLLNGERVAVLSEDQELSPTEASTILGISRPLVVLRMDRGDLPFRYIGKHRRASLKDVLALNTELDVRQKAMEDLAADSENLHLHYGI
ncbi:excisionase [Gluconobacter potus]|uniref:Excisionase n=2 Tax=Acetobacterales TaxID=3120395 RepID=A0A149QTD8_9PROT|nr:MULTISPECIES: helix-turn-helix domain-containing protein [Acetobacteraceae]KXV00387.1 excisionase [Gluconobacter potus]